MPQFLSTIPLFQAHILAGCRLGTQLTQTISFVLFITPGHGQQRKHSSSILARVHFRCNAFTQLFHGNGCRRHISYRDISCIVSCGHYLATAVSLAPQFLLWANTPQYVNSRLILNNRAAPQFRRLVAGFPPRRPRFEPKSCGIYGGQIGIEVGFFRVLRFPLPIFIPPIAPQSPSSITRCWYHRPVVAAVPSGLSRTPLRIIITNLK
jgi:hypothetical protein